MLRYYSGINSADIIDNTVAYIDSWLKALKGDKNMLLVAAAQAEKAYNMILDI